MYQGTKELSDELLLGAHRLFGHHEPSPDLTIFFSGKVGVRQGDEQNRLDVFCDEFRDKIEHRMREYIRLGVSPSILIEVTNKSIDKVFSELKKRIEQ
jgi:thymidylate kinase